MYRSIHKKVHFNVLCNVEHLETIQCSALRTGMFCNNMQLFKKTWQGKALGLPSRVFLLRKQDRHSKGSRRRC